MEDLSKIEKLDDKIDEAFKNNDIKELTKYDYISNAKCNLFIDVALEEGNTDMVKVLTTQFKCQPSLYAKQMAHVNGHHKLALWIESYSTLRYGTIDIKKVHHNYKTSKWNDCIPEEFRY